jgi:glycosyltransferase involved in cell wall biosynthesis
MNIFAYRNCFTGDVSGGDMHTGGVCTWIHEQHPENPLYLVHADNDGQEKAYDDTAILNQITYPGPPIGHPAVMYLRRAGAASKHQLPFDKDSNLLIAGSHFLPDVLPVVKQGARAPGAKRAVYIHHIVQDMPRPKNLNTLMATMQENYCFGLIKKHFDYIITVNQDVVEGLRKRGFTQPILCSSNFVNAHAEQPRPYGGKDITMAFCGRLVRQKGIHDFIATAQALQAEMSDFHAVMIGAGPEKAWLEQTIADAKLHIDVVGRVSDETKFNLLSRAKLFVFPSIEEGWGIAIAEALSVGTPVVGYDLPVYGQPFGSVMHVVPTSNAEALTDRVGSLLAQYTNDPASYAAEQQRLTTRAASFSQQAVAQQEYTFMSTPGAHTTENA